MSHNVLVSNVKIVSLDALRIAVRELIGEGCRINLNESRKTFRTYYQDGREPNDCDMVLELPDSRYDVGFKKQSDGSYVPVYDDMLRYGNPVACEWTPADGGPSTHVRSAVGKLMQRYAVCATELEMALAGHSCSRQKGKDGEMQVVVEYA